MSLSHGRLFGTNGIRFIPGVTKDLDFAINVGECIGTYLGGGEILVGRDGRTSGTALSLALTAGLMSSGSNIAESGTAPTPALQLAVKALGFRGGVMVTASHNPPEYNGFKVMGPDGVEIPRLDEQRIEKIFNDKSQKRADWREVGTARDEPSVIRVYIQAILSRVNSKAISERKFTVVMDTGNGAQGLAAPFLLDSLGCKLITINAVLDGRFPGRGPEPTPDVLGDLIAAVRAANADLGVAYDGDGDRALFCDENGVVYWGDQTGSFLADYLLEKNPGATVITPVSSSQVIESIAKKRNGKVIRTRVGSVDVSRTIIERKALFGFEENGGCIYPTHHPVRDGAMTTALMLECLAARGISFSKAMAYTVPKFYQVKAKVQIAPEKTKDIMKAVEKRSNGRIEKTDGVKSWLDERTWVLVRPSGTEPIIRIFAEAETQKKAEATVRRFVRIVKASS